MQRIIFKPPSLLKVRLMSLKYRTIIQFSFQISIANRLLHGFIKLFHPLSQRSAANRRRRSSPSASCHLSEAERRKRLLLQANSCWCPFSNKSVKSKREDEPRTCLTFLYGLTIGAVKAFHLSSSAGKIRELGLITSTGTVYLYFSSNQN